MTNSPRALAQQIWDAKALIRGLSIGRRQSERIRQRADRERGGSNLSILARAEMGARARGTSTGARGFRSRDGRRIAEVDVKGVGPALAIELFRGGLHECAANPRAVPYLKSYRCIEKLLGS